MSMQDHPDRRPRIEPRDLDAAQRRVPRFLSVDAGAGAGEIPLPHVDPPVRTRNSEEILAELGRLIEHPPKIPRIGLEASSAMRQCFETTAADIDRLAQEQVDRALAIQQEAKSFSTIIREAGDKLCGRIEQEALRSCQISLIMREAVSMVASTPVPDRPAEGG